MVRLTKVRFTGFKKENKSIEVTFSKNNVSIIFGENGSGKTTFLLLLSAVLSQDAKSDFVNLIWPHLPFSFGPTRVMS